MTGKACGAFGLLKHRPVLIIGQSDVTEHLQTAGNAIPGLTRTRETLIGSATALQYTESDFLTETADWPRQNRACSKVRRSFSAKRDSDHLGADSEGSYPVNDFRCLFRVLTSM